MRIWIDVEDLFQYITGNRRPSGIQRLAFELQTALRRLAGPDQVRFLRHDLPGITFSEVAWEDVEALFRTLVEPATHRAAAAQPAPMEGAWRSRARRLVYRLPVPLRVALIRAGRAQIGALRGQVAALRCLPAILRAVLSLRRTHTHHGAPFADNVAPGDVLAVLGSPWFSTGYAAMLTHARSAHGVRVLLLVYDLIPIRHPEWCDRSLVQTFSRWLETCLPLADIVLSISAATARDAERHAAAMGTTLPGPIHPIPIGTGFGTRSAEIARPPHLPPPGSYALFVSTIEARKNHQLLFRAWRRLLDELPPASVPTLVFAGRIGWLVDDLMQQFRNAAWLGGKIVIIEDPSDAELVQLYRGCLFTLFPSLYEGWGLPVTESHAFGKPCIAANVTSLPEAGGALARYFNPDDLGDAVRVIRATITDRDDLAAWEVRVRQDFRPVAWDDSARAILEAIG